MPTTNYSSTDISKDLRHLAIAERRFVQQRKVTPLQDIYQHTNIFVFTMHSM